MNGYDVGQCLHKHVVCSCGKYQNYLCPYSDISKCPSSIEVTAEMVEQWKVKNYIRLNERNEVIW